MDKSKLSKEDELKLKHINFIKKIDDRFGDEYTVLGTFINTTTRVLIRHNKCGHEWTPFPRNILTRKSKCPRCSGKVQYTTEEYKKLIKDVTNDGYEVLGEYVNNLTKVKVKHKECGYIWDTKPSALSADGVRCPRCQKRERYTSDDFSNLIKEITNGEYLLTGNYINNRTKISVMHLECGNTFTLTPISFLYHDQRCPCCNPSISKGEQKIYNYLINKNIKFTREYTFDDCRYKLPLPFDFAIFNNENKLICLIEYDGGQHFEPVEYFGGEEGFKIQQKRDKIKSDYCKANHIQLLRIPYWEFKNIENVLNDFINNFKMRCAI